MVATVTMILSNIGPSVQSIKKFWKTLIMY